MSIPANVHLWNPASPATELHAQVPATLLPTHHSRFPSPNDQVIGSSQPFQPFQPARVAILSSMAQRKIGGLSAGRASQAWLHQRLSLPWPTCTEVEDDSEDPQRRAKALESLPPRSSSQGPPLSSSLATEGTVIMHEVNSAQPTHHPAMIITSAKQEREAERIKGGSACCCRFTIAGPQGNSPGITIDTTRSQTNFSRQLEKRPGSPEGLTPGERPRERTQSRASIGRLALSTRIPNDNERVYYGLAAAAPSFNTIESSISGNQLPPTNAADSTNIPIEGAVSGDTSGIDAQRATVEPVTSGDSCVPAQRAESSLPSM